MKGSEEAQRQNISSMRVPNKRLPLSHPELEQLANEIADRFAERVKELPEEFFGRKRTDGV